MLTTATDLLREWHDGNTIFNVFAGSGVGQGPPANLPSWHTLTRDLYKRTKDLGLLHGHRDNTTIRKLLSSCRYPDALQLLSDRLGLSFVNFVATTLSWDGDPTRIASLLSRASRHRLVTTNLDRSLDQTTNRERLTASSSGLLDALKHPRTSIIKLHGDIKDASTWILTKSDYDRAYGAGSALRKGLESIFVTSPTLFVGFSFRDPDISRIIKDLSSTFRAGRQRYYLLLPASEICNESTLVQLGLSILRFDDKPTIAAGLERFLLRLVPGTLIANTPPSLPQAAVNSADKQRASVNSKLVNLFALRDELESTNQPADEVRESIRTLRRELHNVSFVDVGETIHGHVALKRLGEGNYGTVWLVRSTEAGAPRALKIFHPHHAMDEEKRARFIRGIKAMESLTHPHVVRIFGRYEAPLSFIMEYVEGSDLERALTQKPERGGLELSDADLAELLVQVARTVDFAHGRDVFHRDLKPANILLRYGKPHAFLTDFDIAYYDGATTLTLDGRGVGGTMGYAAPEQLKARTGDVRSPAVDVYSFGMIVAFWISRRDPDLEDVIKGTLADRVFREAEARLKSRWAAKLISELVQHAGAYDPVKRMSMTDLTERLERVGGVLRRNGFSNDQAGFLDELRSRLPNEGVDNQVSIDRDGNVVVAIVGERTMIGAKSSFAKAIGPAIAAAKAKCATKHIEVLSAEHGGERFRFVVRHQTGAPTVGEAIRVSDSISEVVRYFQPR